MRVAKAHRADPKVKKRILVACPGQINSLVFTEKSMRRSSYGLAFRVLAGLMVVAFGVALWTRPAAAMASGTIELKFDYWPTNENATDQFGSGSWNTQIWGGDFRFTSNQNWGIHLKYETGTQSNWSAFVGATGGQDTVWSGDVFYGWQFPRATLRVFAGYGHIEYRFTNPVSFLDSTNTGYRVGVDGVIPLPNSRWQFNGGVAWYPSLSASLTSNALGTFTGSGNAQDYSASFQYNFPSGWLAEIGYRWINVSTSGYTVGPYTFLNFQQNGPFLAVGYHW